MPPRIHVFAGPSLSGREVRGVLPDAVLHPPVAAGDLARLRVAAGDVVVVLDGPLTAGRAVRHKEILGLLDRGVEVWGAAGTGALRAVELQACGMRAYGRVARLVARGVLDGDDEVAVHHQGPDRRWSARGVALVDIRVTCRDACRGGLVDGDGAEQVVAAARALPIEHRLWDEVLAHAVEAGLDADVAWRLGEHARKHAARLLHDDAVGCLRAVRRARGDAPRPRPRAAAAVVTTVFAHLWDAEVSGDVQPGPGLVSDADVLSFCRLLAVDYPGFQRSVALRTLAALSRPRPRAGEREGHAMLREFTQRQRLDSDSLVLWLAERGLRRDELLAHLRREHTVANLLAAAGVSVHDDTGVIEALADVVTEHARRRGFMAPGPLRTWERAWLSATEMELLPEAERIARLASRSFRSAPGADWRGPLLQELKVSGVFRVAREGAGQAQQDWRELEARDPQGAAAAADPEALAGWAAERWQVRERFDLALRDRGFKDAADFATRAPMVAALDRTVSTYHDLHCLGRRAALAWS